MIFDPEMMAGLQRLAEMKPEDLTPEQREAVRAAIETADKAIAGFAAPMKVEQE